VAPPTDQLPNSTDRQITSPHKRSRVVKVPIVRTPDHRFTLKK
jgi:hypothetical protein